ncbi:Uu.00g011200.m01.CDS01 [Anthostomella pinea]|uniref:Uu.00g011200.m01.CDS01 n=1 Tax=Anthostomella pinea TaxID=933095 RepID=A0AAI8VRY7_9PEZI|nr:Uu.00g011200.m01.CDS01 [Anthostomella pinea]
MFSKLIIIAALSAAALGSRTCGTPEPSDDHRETTRWMQVQEKAGNVNQAIPTVNAYFHVVAAGVTEDQGYIPQQKLTAQLDYMNAAYTPSGISFNLAAIDYVVNSNWSANGDELGMKQALRKGSYADLNVYFLGDLGNDLGYCYFPNSITPGTRAFYKDGCSVLAQSVPGGAATNYNQGGTVVHEVGHWFGLYHTFQGNNCTGLGDQIDDTPAQASATSGCPATRDSCPGQVGLDPIHNFMDYSIDRCYQQFTPQQTVRMQSMWAQYRA